ncbi:FGGY family carbohydrate kinase [Echinicola vietnamensis]|uniref:ATP:glycerol 3-phosphotransferase n=1 Tax=Echinicola vietnamensis (strain DSM 17526 / LMG 23754 / KMM 6221) TaxID=926556 RepID=L0FY47_ECHVK|nr:glycerol kinase GlpK [Echinicola vietnamensis]AGA77550.1 glycerol kinase [Echinicola vietnamensis DSM 17526]
MDSNKQFILSIDQGTSGTKALVFDAQGKQVAKATVPLKTHYLDGGLVEQDPEDIYQNVLKAVGICLADFQFQGHPLDAITSCGISNQRETFLLWDKNGAPLYQAVVWQCKRSIGVCDRLKAAGLEPLIKDKTGLIIDPYFSGTKLIWLYENDPAIATAIDAGEAYFGTVDTWLLYRLTEGNHYLTDFTNASRTLFFNLDTLDWDRELLDNMGLSGLQLPAVRPSSAEFGVTDFEGLLDAPLPIFAMIGDSHAAAFGEACFEPGTAKATMGTGCSVLMNVGDERKSSGHGMVSTICWSTEAQVSYALEGVIVTCGATIEWLKNELGLIQDSRETEAMAKAVTSNQGVYLVPAFSGLGAPHWDMKRKASLVGMTFDSGKNHIVRAALESIPYQIKDVISAMEEDAQLDLEALNVDGGITANGFVIDFLADLLEKPVARVGIADVSALGAAYLAGLKAGVFKDLAHLQQLQQKQQTVPNGPADSIKAAYAGWQRAVKGNTDNS